MNIQDAIRQANGSGIIRRDSEPSTGYIVEGDDLISITGRHDMKVIHYADQARKLAADDWSA